jgi:hypothetical protein
MLLFFSVARSAQTSQAERATQASGTDAATTSDTTPVEAGEKMPTDKLVDVSPLALRMSSPFNSSYWLNAA